MPEEKDPKKTKSPIGSTKSLGESMAKAAIEDMAKESAERNRDDKECALAIDADSFVEGFLKECAKGGADPLKTIARAAQRAGVRLSEPPPSDPAKKTAHCLLLAVVKRLVEDFLGNEYGGNLTEAVVDMLGKPDIYDDDWDSEDDGDEREEPGPRFVAVPMMVEYSFSW